MLGRCSLWGDYRRQRPRARLQGHFDVEQFAHLCPGRWFVGVKSQSRQTLLGGGAEGDLSLSPCPGRPVPGLCRGAWAAFCPAAEAPLQSWAMGCPLPSPRRPEGGAGPTLSLQPGHRGRCDRGTAGAPSGSGVLAVLPVPRETCDALGTDAQSSEPRPGGQAGPGAPAFRRAALGLFAFSGPAVLAVTGLLSAAFVPPLPSVSPYSSSQNHALSFLSVPCLGLFRSAL